MRTLEEITKEYFAAMTNWNVALHKALVDCSTRDEIAQAESRFVADNEGAYRTLQELRLEYTLAHQAVSEREVIADEQRAEHSQHLNEILDSRSEAVISTFEKVPAE